MILQKAERAVPHSWRYFVSSGQCKALEGAQMHPRQVLKRKNVNNELAGNKVSIPAQTTSPFA